MVRIHDLFIVELAEVIKGYGNDPDVEDPFRLSEFYRFYELPNIAVSRENFEKMRPAQPESDCVLKEFGDCSYSETGCSDCKVKEKIRNALSIQSKRKKGHWFIDSDGYYPYCSECRTEPSSGHMTDFCPNCGADMRGTKND